MAKGQFQIQDLRGKKKTATWDLATYIVNFLKGMPLVSSEVIGMLKIKINALIEANDNLSESEREYYDEYIQKLESRIDKLERSSGLWTKLK